MLREEIEEAVRSLKTGKSPEVDNMLSGLIKNGGEATTIVLTKDKGMAERVDTIACHTFSKESNLKQYQNYCTINLLSHPSKTMLRVILN